MNDQKGECFGALARAKVAELVDALDLGSSVLRTWEFKSPLSHHVPGDQARRTGAMLSGLVFFQGPRRALIHVPVGRPVAAVPGRTTYEISMQVSVESTGTLARRMTVALPNDDIESAVSDRLQSISKTARLNGFRPGKVPFKVVKKRFGPQVRSEVLGGLINSALRDALLQEDIRLAGRPAIENVEEPGKNGVAEDPDTGFRFIATFEVYPEFEPAYGEGIKVTRPVVEIVDADIDEMLESLRKQRTEYSTVERAANDQDQVVIDFTGFIDDEAFDGGAAEKAPLVLGSNAMIPGFEEQLIGVVAGDEKSIEVTFPETYQAENLAGKTARFDIVVHEVKEPILPELDEEMVKSFGIEDGSLESLRADIRKNMDRELGQRVDSQIKSQVMDGLVACNEIEVPEALVSDEIEHQRKQMLGQLPEGSDGSFLSDDLFREQAIKRVRLGLVVGEIIRRDELKADADAVRAQIEKLASSYEDPMDVIEHYYGDENLLRNVEGLVLESTVTERVLAVSSVTDEHKSFKDMMNPPKPTESDDESSSDDETTEQEA